MKGFIEPLTQQCTEKISKQMGNSFYKIDINGDISVIGIFCYIKYQKMNIPALLLNKYIKLEDVDETLKILVNNEVIIIKLGNAKYHNEKYNITILEIKENKNDNINYLEIDDLLYEKDSEIYYSNKSIYILHYNNKNKTLVSYNSIKDINKSFLYYNYKTIGQYKLNVIFNSSTNKIIGIDNNINKNHINNKSIFINFLIKEFIFEYKYSNKYMNRYKNSNNIKNEINILIKAEQEDVDNRKKINFLCYKYYNFKENKYIYCHGKLKELNKENTELFINDKKYEYKNYLIPKRKGLYSIKLKFNNKLKDCSYMFAGCEKIIKINLKNFNTKQVSNAERMFHGCENLQYLDLSSFDTNNANNLSNMFSLCINLNKLNLCSFITKNVADMSSMFQSCKNLKELNLSSFNTYNVNNMASMFQNCDKLINLDLLSFNTHNVTDMSYMFNECKNIIILTPSILCF